MRVLHQQQCPWLQMPQTCTSLVPTVVRGRRRHAPLLPAAVSVSPYDTDLHLTGPNTRPTVARPDPGQQQCPWLQMPRTCTSLTWMLCEQRSSSLHPSSAAVSAAPNATDLHLTEVDARRRQPVVQKLQMLTGRMAPHRDDPSMESVENSSNLVYPARRTIYCGGFLACGTPPF